VAYPAGPCAWPPTALCGSRPATNRITDTMASATPPAYVTSSIPPPPRHLNGWIRRDATVPPWRLRRCWPFHPEPQLRDAVRPEQLLAATTPPAMPADPACFVPTFPTSCSTPVHQGCSSTAASQQTAGNQRFNQFDQFDTIRRLNFPNKAVPHFDGDDPTSPTVLGGGGGSRHCHAIQSGGVPSLLLVSSGNSPTAAGTTQVLGGGFTSGSGYFSSPSISRSENPNSSTGRWHARPSDFL